MDQNTARSVAFQLLPNQSRSWADLARVVDERVLHQILRQFGVSDPSEVPQGRRAEWDEVLAAAHRTLAPAQTPLDWALAYAAAGWSVLPADPKTREPLMDLGVTHATTDPVSIRSWWAACPQAVPALGCKLSGVFAIDLDCKPGKTDGRTTWAGVTQGRELPGALVATTPSGGRHLIFRAPIGAPVKSPVEFWPGIDFKGGNGSGGYVLLPCGQGDRIWLQGDPRTDHAVEAPEWLVAIIPRRKEKEPEEIEEPARQPAREDLEDDLARAEWVLQHVFPDADALDYGQWLFRLMELASLGEKGVALAKAWNARGSRGKYNPSVDDARFDGFNGERQIASLFAAADEKAPGWRKAQKSEARVAASAAAFSPLGAAGGMGNGGSLFDEEPAPQPGALLIPADRFVAQAGTQMFLVKNLLARTGVSLFFGAPASGKTPFVMSLALAVAGGVPQWFGRKVMRHGTVVYMVGEDSSGVGHRLKAECAARGWGLDSIAKTLLFTARPGRLIEMADAANWVREIKAVVGDGDLAMLVIDTQNQNFGAGSENDAEDMLAFLMSLRFLSETLRCAIVMTHHPGHMNTDRARGHSSLEAAVESRFEVKATKEEDGSVSVAACDHKHKNWADPGVLQATLVPRVVYTDSDGDAVTAITLVEGGSTAFMRDGELQKLLALVAEQEANGKVKLPERKMAELLGWSRRQVREGINRAMVHGALSKTDEKSKNPVYVLTATGLAIVESLGPKSLDQATFRRQSESLVQPPWTKPDQSLLD